MNMNGYKRTIPFGIMLIASFYAFGAAILLLFFFINPTQAASAIALSHGLPSSTGSWILPVIAGLALLIATSLYSLSRWGYVLTLVYLLYFGRVNWFLYADEASWTYLGNGLWSLLVILYLFLVRRRFFQKNANKPVIL
jgi:hypothetical protein